jgi:hypothetical protein
MTRDQTTNFRGSAAPFFLGSIALAQLNFAFSRLGIKLLGRLSRSRSKFHRRRLSALASRRLFEVSSP